MGKGNLSPSLKPSGKLTPQRFLNPLAYTLHECPAKYPLITISTLTGSQARPKAAFGAGTSKSQLGTISLALFKK